jgi:hypothetical protein
MQYSIYTFGTHWFCHVKFVVLKYKLRLNRDQAGLDEFANIIPFY